MALTDVTEDKLVLRRGSLVLFKVYRDSSGPGRSEGYGVCASVERGQSLLRRVGLSNVKPVIASVSEF